MENELKPKTRFAELQETIANSAFAIESEFDKTANDWLSCFGSRVFVIETYLSSKKVEELLLPEKHQKALSKLEALKEQLRTLKKRYPSKDTIPPEDIKQDLLNDLDVLKWMERLNNLAPI